jgi:Tfp pilus assembly protein PilX
MRYAKVKTRLLKRSRRGAAAVLAMLFLVLFTTLSLAMLSLAVTNTHSASNLSDVARAQDAAEGGLRFMQYRFVKMDRPKTTIGNITAAVAVTLWPDLQDAIREDFLNQLNPSEQLWTPETNGGSMTSGEIS